MSDYKPTGKHYALLFEQVLYASAATKTHTEHDGLRKDGQPDQRVGTGEFAHGKVDPHEAGKQGGHTSGTGSSSYDDGDNSSSGNSGQFAHGKVDPHEAGKKGGRSGGTGSSYDGGDDNSGDTYKPTEHGGQTKDGKPDGRVKGN
jgi:hypothetical protein